MKLLGLLYVVGFISALDIAPESHEVEYVNHKYLKYLTVSFRKLSRNKPHIVNMKLESTVGVGNNFTLKMALFEHLGGHYIPTPIMGNYKLCEFLDKEPFFGQMYAKQLAANWSCPFPPGVYRFSNFSINLENFPYNIPFTYSSMIVRTRADVQGVFTTTNEEVFSMKTFVKITQKLNDGKKTKALSRSHN